MMKMAHKSCGLCTCAAVIVLTYTGVFKNMEPFSILYLDLLGGMVAAFFGYQIGDILSNPKGTPPAKRKPAQKQAAPAKAEPVTGEETFLSDLDTPPDQKSP